MWLLYYSGICLYTAIVRIAALFSVKAGLWYKGRKGLFMKLSSAIPPDKKTIWMHCASLGEFEMGRPVLEALRKEYPDYFLVLTFFSPSGYEIRKNYTGADLVSYLPTDCPGSARRFVETIHPSLAVFVKYEFWFGYLHALHRRKIPTMLISGRFRPEQHFFRWYGGWFYRRLFCFSSLHLQDEQSVRLAGEPLKSRLVLSGDTRYDRVAANAGLRRELPEILNWLDGRQCLVAGSTWPVDDKLMLPWEHPSLALIIAPHEVHAQRIQSLKQLAGEDGILYSELSSGRKTKILIIDNIGMLLSIYALGKLAYVGGAFGSGLHNILEPAAFGLPVIFGPNHQKFPEAAAMEQTGAALTITDRNSFQQAITQLSSAERYPEVSAQARNFVAARTGATPLIMETIRTLLK